jgi:hypothetical protein
MQCVIRNSTPLRNGINLCNLPWPGCSTHQPKQTPSLLSRSFALPGSGAPHPFCTPQQSIIQMMNIRELPGSASARTPSILTEYVRGFLQALHANSGTLPYYVTTHVQCACCHTNKQAPVSLSLSSDYTTGHIVVRFPTGTTETSLLRKAQDRLWAHPAPYLPHSIRTAGEQIATHLFLVSRLSIK